MRASIRTPEIRDPALRAAAETLDRFVGKKGDREVLSGELDAAEKLLADHRNAIASGKKSPFGKLHPGAIINLEQHLPELRKLFDGDAPKEKFKTFCNSFWTDAVAHDAARACAQAIAGALAGDPQELTLAHFLQARDVMNGKQTHGGREETVMVTEKLRATMADETINAAAMEALDHFFLTGGGGIMSHGPCWITEDFRFDDVYRLPTKGAKDDDDYQKLISEYEAMFKKCGYDRIYVKGSAGELYVALNESGSVDWILEGFRMKMRNDDHKRPSGEVLRVVDERNSLGEATYKLWLKTVEKFADAWDGAVEDKHSKAIDEAARALVEGIPATREQKGDAKGMLLTTLLLSVAGGLTAVLPPVGLGILGATGLMSGTAFVKYLFLQHDKTPVLYAMGVTPNERQPNWY